MVYTHTVYRPVGVMHPRHIEIEGAHNVRDIGGYATLDGRTIRWRTLLRADGLHHLSSDDTRRLHSLGLRTVVDLRFAGELSSAPDAFSQSARVAYRHVPLHEDKMQDARDGRIQLPPTLESYYRMLLDECGPQIGRVFDILATPGALPGLVHCTLGKDRTGVIIALLLDLLRVPDHTIVEDYMLTERHATALLGRMRLRAASAGPFGDWHLRMLECKPETMRATLRYVHSRYGGATGYLSHAGVSIRQQANLVAALLD
jgi:protein-tyrosine phosphatase